ncbi:MAG: helix-turn-helix domain-containing protein, partial [Roseomonas sp.]|nr:helix-turn-helix domain-containing protein [Roseomonas sp.]
MTENDDVDELLDMDGLAARLKLPKASVYKLVAAGRIPGQKVGKHWRFLPSEIDAWLRAGMRSPRRPAPAAAAPVRAPVAFAGGGAPAHFEAALAPAAISAGAGGASGGAMQGVFTAA